MKLLWRRLPHRKISAPQIGGCYECLVPGCFQRWRVHAASQRDRIAFTRQTGPVHRFVRRSARRACPAPVPVRLDGRIQTAEAKLRVSGVKKKTPWIAVIAALGILTSIGKAAQTGRLLNESAPVNTVASSVITSIPRISEPTVILMIGAALLGCCRRGRRRSPLTRPRTTSAHRLGF